MICQLKLAGFSRWLPSGNQTWQPSIGWLSIARFNIKHSLNGPIYPILPYPTLPYLSYPILSIYRSPTSTMVSAGVNMCWLLRWVPPQWTWLPHQAWPPELFPAWSAPSLGMLGGGTVSYAIVGKYRTKWTKWWESMGKWWFIAWFYLAKNGDVYLDSFSKLV